MFGDNYSSNSAFPTPGIGTVALMAAAALGLGAYLFYQHVRKPRAKPAVVADMAVLDYDDPNNPVGDFSVGVPLDEALQD